MHRSEAHPKDVILQIKSSGFLPVFYHTDVNTILHAIRVSYRCGVRVFEFLHQRDNRGLRMFSWLVEQTQNMPDLCLGAGTVLDSVMAERYIAAGAQFIASPFLRSDMAQVCGKLNTLWIPGCASQQDVVHASELGAGAVMLLPGGALDPDFLRNAVISFSPMSFIPSGGNLATEENLKNWIYAGALGVRMNDPLFEREAIAQNDWDRVEKNIRGVIRTIEKLKSTGRKSAPLNISLL